MRIISESLSQLRAPSTTAPSNTSPGQSAFPSSSSFSSHAATMLCNTPHLPVSVTISVPALQTANDDDSAIQKMQSALLALKLKQKEKEKSRKRDVGTVAFGAGTPTNRNKTPVPVMEDSAVPSSSSSSSLMQSDNCGRVKRAPKRPSYTSTTQAQTSASTLPPTASISPKPDTDFLSQTGTGSGPKWRSRTRSYVWKGEVSSPSQQVGPKGTGLQSKRGTTLGSGQGVSGE